MKKLFAVSALALSLIGSTALANTFDRTIAVATFTSDKVSLKFSGDTDGFDSAFADFKIYEGVTLGLNSDLKVGFGRVESTSSTLLTAEYTMGDTLEGSVWVAYALDTNSGNEWTIVPKLAKTYALNDKTDLFGSVSYQFGGDAGDLNGQGGLIEIGLGRDINSTFTIRGSLVQEFTKNDLQDVNAKIELVTRF